VDGILLLDDREGTPLYSKIENAIELFRAKTGRLPTECEISTLEDFVPQPEEISGASLNFIRPSKLVHKNEIKLGPVG
jgi:hypothetical protein